MLLAIFDRWSSRITFFWWSQSWSKQKASRSEFVLGFCALSSIFFCLACFFPMFKLMRRRGLVKPPPCSKESLTPGERVGKKGLGRMESSHTLLHWEITAYFFCEQDRDSLVDLPLGVVSVLSLWRAAKSARVRMDAEFRDFRVSQSLIGGQLLPVRGGGRATFQERLGPISPHNPFVSLAPARPAGALPRHHRPGPFSGRRPRCPRPDGRFAPPIDPLFFIKFHKTLVRSLFYGLHPIPSKGFFVKLRPHRHQITSGL